MNPWLDSLSEDWVSQHDSSSSSLPADNSKPSDHSDKPGHVANSRIPRLKTNPSPGSVVNQDRSAMARSTGSSAPRTGTGRILKDRSTSNKNIVEPRANIEPAIAGSDCKPSKQSQSDVQPLSSSAYQSIQRYDTVAHNRSSSLQKGKENGDTPEWRRRLLGGEAAYGKGRDLFGPIGLENMFQPPTVPTHKQPKQPNPDTSINLPSSPPQLEITPSTQLWVGKPTSNTEGKSMQQGSGGWSHASGADGSDPRAHARHRRQISLSEVRSSSGFDDTRNEGISPIYISRHHSIGSMIDYAGYDDSQAPSLRRSASVDSQIHKSRSWNDEGSGPGTSIAELQRTGPPNQDRTEVPTRPNDISTTSTQEFMRHGGFINLRRGGGINDESFPKRDLSSVSVPSEKDSFMIQEESHDEGTPERVRPAETPDPPSSSKVDEIPESTQSAAPKTPIGSPQRHEKKPSGSPLKLFGGYDTFTNGKLLCRVNQFENSLHDGSDRAGNGGSDAPREETDHIESSAARLRKLKAPRRRARPGQQEEELGGPRMSSFGLGELSNYAFHQAFPSSHPHSLHDGNVSMVSGDEKQRQRRDPFSGDDMSRADLDQIEDDCDIKRPPSSPAKGPDPKRRRTFQREEFEEILAIDETAQIAEDARQLPSLIGKKRKDARYDDSSHAADPEVMAMRRILRARALANGQVVRQSSISSIPEGRPLEELQLRTDAPTTAGDTRVTPAPQAKSSASLTVLGNGQPMMNGSRQGSITTQDYVDDAVWVMERIRAARAQGGDVGSLTRPEPENATVVPLPDLQDQEAEHENPPEDDMDSVPDEFLRPPSREGGPAWKPKPQKQTDPVLVDHLRKYAESSDAPIVSSLRSLQIAATLPKNKPLEKYGAVDMESQPSNIRITEQDGRGVRRASAHPEHETESSDPSSRISSGHTGRTSHSTRSDAKHTIGPDKVSHLIPEQIAGMVYDHVQQAWIKKRRNSLASLGNIEAEEESEDPLQDIPDLSVDTADAPQIHSTNPTDEADAQRRTPRPQIAKGKEQQQAGNPAHGRIGLAVGSQSHVETSSVPSKFSRFASSGHQTETRATSWGDADHLPIDNPKTLQRTAQTLTESKVASTAYAEHESHDEEEREATARGPRESGRRRRDLSIAFSSPLVSHVHRRLGGDESTDGKSEHWHNQSEQASSDTRAGQNEEPDKSWLRQRTGRPTSVRDFATAPINHGTSARVSFGGRSYTVHPVPTIDEHREVSLADLSIVATRATSRDLTLSTPLPRRHGDDTSLAVLSSAHRSNVTFHLTPLPDFTIHQDDGAANFEANQVARIQKDLRAEAAKGAQSQSSSALIKNLTDVEPYEPYWDYIQRLEIKKRGLATLHRLNEFCGRLEELDISDNEITHLTGAPSTIRHLLVANNRLSSLTAWHALTNIQYLDISGNEVDSLESLSCLVHLRELRVDNNKISSLGGIFGLNGLTSLRARRNRLSAIDFEGADLRRLSELDLRGNELVEVNNLHVLSGLVHLNLDENRLVQFGPPSAQPLRHVRTLKVTANRLETLDVAAFSDLRVLYADRNKLRRVGGINKTRHLNSFSMREQDDATDDRKHELALNAYRDVRKLYASANRLSSSPMAVTFLNLQYLELASAGLQSLPSNFGKLIPGVRVLNLNANALKDIRCLDGIVRLKKLLLAGNRLSRLRQTADTLAKFTSLTKVDLRNNPLTLAFYPSVVERRVVHQRDDEQGGGQAGRESGADPFSLPDPDLERDETYRGRLDSDTQLRRRVYELLIASACGCLHSLDGLELDRARIMARDEVWTRLASLGIVGADGQQRLEQRRDGEGALGKTAGA